MLLDIPQTQERGTGRCFIREDNPNYLSIKLDLDLGKSFSMVDAPLC